MSAEDSLKFGGQFEKCKNDGTCVRIEEGRTFHCFRFDAQCKSTTCKHLRQPLGEHIKREWSKLKK